MLTAFQLRSFARYRALWPVLMASLCTCMAWAEEVELTSLTGESRKASITSIDAQGMVDLGGKTIRLEELRSIDRLTPSSGKGRNAIKVCLSGDGQLFAKSIEISDEVCVVSGHGLGDAPIQVPIDLVTGIAFQPDDLPESIEKSFGEERDEDQLILQLDGSLETLNGLVEELTESNVTFLWNEETRTIPTKNLIAIAVASTGELSQAKCLIRFSSGASIAGEIQSLENNQLKVSMTEEIQITVDWKKVQQVTIRSDRLQILSDLEPQAFEHTPIVTSERSWKKNRNVSGNRLKLGVREYSSGIGVASNSRLEYQLSGEFSRFCATIGIDAQTEGRGECVFVVLGDGKELTRKTMTGASDPFRLELDIQGIRTLELMVEAGADLDLADHANWCDACLLRP